MGIYVIDYYEVKKEGFFYVMIGNNFWKKLSEKSKLYSYVYSKFYLFKKRKNCIFVCLGIEIFMERVIRNWGFWWRKLGVGGVIFLIFFWIFWILYFFKN